MAAVKDGHQLWLVVFAVICAAIGAIYYFRVIQAMYFKEPVDGINEQRSTQPQVINGCWLLLQRLSYLLGVLPGLVIDWIYY